MKQVLFAPTGICIQHHGSYTIPNYTIAFLWLYRAILQFFCCAAKYDRSDIMF